MFARTQTNKILTNSESSTVPCRGASGSRACEGQCAGISGGRQRHAASRLRVGDIIIFISFLNVLNGVLWKTFLQLFPFLNYFSSVFSVLSLSAVQFSDSNSISRYLARVAPALGLYGANTMEQTEVCVCFICV